MQMRNPTPSPVHASSCLGLYAALPRTLPTCSHGDHSGLEHVYSWIGDPPWRDKGQAWDSQCSEQLRFIVQDMGVRKRAKLNNELHRSK